MKKDIKPLSGLCNQENKDWYNAGFKGGFKDCKEQVLKIIKNDIHRIDGTLHHEGICSDVLDKIKKL